VVMGKQTGDLKVSTYGVAADYQGTECIGSG
jgi:hypothetical protein